MYEAKGFEDVVSALQEYIQHPIKNFKRLIPVDPKTRREKKKWTKTTATTNKTTAIRYKEN